MTRETYTTRTGHAWHLQGNVLHVVTGTVKSGYSVDTYIHGTERAIVRERVRDIYSAIVRFMQKTGRL